MLTLDKPKTARRVHREEYEVALQNLTAAMAFGCKRNHSRATTFSHAVYGYVNQLEGELQILRAKYKLIIDEERSG